MDIQQEMRGRIKALLLLPLILSLALSSASFGHHSQRSAAGFPFDSYQSLALAPFGSAYPYDEQVGVTFTQDFSVVAFNVTAVPFADSSGVGPGYLVNGLTDLGYWYQVGLAYNWPRTSGAINYGFNMLYEVFDPKGNSIYPLNGGGLQSFNGPVNTRDTVQLSLSFSSKHVVMQAIDWQTGAVSSQSFTSYGSIFKGLQSRLAQSGFFTGLMTEQYHGNPYYDPGVPVAYNEIGTSLYSAWMWMDEWNTDTNQTVFRDNTTSPVQLDSSLGRYFSSNGTAEVANAHGLVTGITPIVFPSLSAGPATTGSPGRQAQIPITITDPRGGTVRFTKLNISATFGTYNFSLTTPFTFASGTIDYNIAIGVPANVGFGNYNLTIAIWSWQYLDAQSQEWIPLQQATLNATLVLTNNPVPPPNPHSNPPNSGQGPSTSTNKTSPAPVNLLGVIRSVIIPFAAGYAALGVLALVLLIRQQRKRSTSGPIPVPIFCRNCGNELSFGALICPSCGISTETSTSPENQEPGASSPSQALA